MWEPIVGLDIDIVSKVYKKNNFGMNDICFFFLQCSGLLDFFLMKPVIRYTVIKRYELYNDIERYTDGNPRPMKVNQYHAGHPASNSHLKLTIDRWLLIFSLFLNSYFSKTKLIFTFIKNQYSIKKYEEDKTYIF